MGHIPRQHQQGITGAEISFFLISCHGAVAIINKVNVGTGGRQSYSPVWLNDDPAHLEIFGRRSENFFMRVIGVTR
jgi:hypothetical protein